MSDIPIKVEVARSGGFAGVETHAAVDTELMPADRAAEIRSLVQRLDPAALSDGFSAPAAEGARRRSAADRFEYDVEIVVGDEVHRFSIGEGQVPGELRSLLDRVMRYGRDG